MMQRSPNTYEQLNITGENVHTSHGLHRLREHPFDAVQRIAGEIGPRPATSLTEAQAAAYLDGRLRRAGLSVSADAFRTPRLTGIDGLLLGLSAIVSIALYSWFPLSALLISLLGLAIASIMLIQRGRPLLTYYRFSQNVIATRATTDTPRWRVVLLAPLDSPLALGRLVRLLNSGIRPLTGRVIAYGLIVFFGLIGLWNYRMVWIYAQTVPGVYLALLAILDLWSLRATPTAGAVSHAGALAVLLASAEELHSLDQTELWAVALGATSTQTGLDDLLRRYPFNSTTTLFIGLEGIGSGTLSYVTSGGLFRTRIADPLLLQLAAATDATDPLINAEPRSYSGIPTIVSPLQRIGRRTMTITCLNANGHTPYRNSLADTPTILDPQILERATRFVVGLVRKIDATVPEH